MFSLWKIDPIGKFHNFLKPFPRQNLNTFYYRRVVASCHLELKEPEKGVDVVEHNLYVGKQVKELFHQEGIHSTTIQLEYSSE